MYHEFKLRSIPDKANYATYLALPALELSRYSFGEGNFVNSYITINCQIGVLVKDLKQVPWAFWEHKCYRTDMPYYDGVLILFKPPVWFEQDMIALLNSQYSKLSELALEAIKECSGLPVDFRNSDGTVSTHRLILAIRKDSQVRKLLSDYLNAEITPDMELEPPMREQDILYDVDTDINFIYEEYQKGGEDASKDNKD